MSARYEILKELGKGAMGEVVLATDTKLSRKVALKFLAVQVESDKEYVDRIMREARIAADLNHTNIVHIYDFGQFKDSEDNSAYNKRTYISMEYVEGKTLKAYLKETDRLSNENILGIARQIAEALAYAHKRRIFHRDIKPENILITEDGKLKLLDFGLAKSGNISTLTGEQILGTPYYMSPEQSDGDQDIDYRTDIFSFGIVLYELITHKRPFQGDSFEVVRHEIQHTEPTPVNVLNEDAPKGFQRILEKCLAKKREDRYQSASQIVKALEREERIIKPYDALTIRMDDTSKNEWKESIVNEAKTLRRQKETEEVQKLLATGRRRYAKGKYDAAVESFKGVIVIDPEHAEANNYLEKIRKSLEQSEVVEKFIADAEFYQSKRKYEEANELYERVLKMDPHNRVAKKGLARAERYLGGGSAKSLAWLGPRLILLAAGLVVAWLVADNFGSKTPPSVSEKSASQDMPVAAKEADINPEVSEPDIAPKADTQKAAALAAKDRMLQEKQGAELVDAPNFAKVTFESGLAKERQGIAKLESGQFDELAQAEQLFRQAANIYADAVTEAEAQQTAQVDAAISRSKADSEKQRMVAQKQRVPASAHSSSKYRAAQTLEINGNTQFENSDFVSASASYRQARIRYREAIDEFDATQRAEQARRAQQLAEQQRAIADKAQQDFTRRIQAVGEPNWETEAEFAGVKEQYAKASNAYGTGKFQQAASFYSAAADMLEAIETERETRRRALAHAKEQDRKALEAVFEQFKSSIENGNFATFKRLLPMTKKEEASWALFFKIAEQPRAEITASSPAIKDDKASMIIRGTIHFTTGGNQQTSPIDQSWILSKAGGSWEIISK